IGHSDFAAWKDESPHVEELGKAGKLALAEAVLEAQEALASGDEQRIITAALICPTLIREGQRLHRQHRDTNGRRAGGKARGTAQHYAAMKRVEPYAKMYRDKLAGSVPYLIARRSVVSKMIRDREPVPSQPTLRKWFPKPKK